MLCGLDEIRKAFRVRREMVVEWIRRGAPIAYIGKGRYRADYEMLYGWLLDNPKKDDEMLVE